MQSRLKIALAFCCLAALVTASGAAASGGALVRVEGLVLRANGDYRPHALPRHGYAPISFHGYFDVRSTVGGRPPQVQQVILKFDRDGRLSAGGLATCPAERVAVLGPAAARRACHGAIVGTGRVQAEIDLLGVMVKASAPLTIFNGPREAGHPTVVLHSEAPVPVPEIYAIPAPIERLHGEYGYRVTIDVPPIEGGLASITRVSANVGRRFQAGGRRRSYVSARCTSGVLRVHGDFTFETGTVIYGSIEKACRVK